jgi:hypothetical protein
MIYLHELAIRLLDYNGVAVADVAQVPSIKREIYDSICSALGRMYEKAPGLFQRSHEGGYLYAPITGTGNCDTVFISQSAALICRNALCTVRIEGSEPDHTVRNYALLPMAPDPPLTIALFSPSSTSTPSLTTPFKSFHDAFIVPSGRRVVGDVSINNTPLNRVADRDHARKMCGVLNPKFATGTPLYWWLDIIVPTLDPFFESEFGDVNLLTTSVSSVIGFYPMPDKATGFTYESLWEPASLTDLTTLFSDTSPVSLGLSAQTAREILLPLAVEKYTAKPTFSNARLLSAIAKDATRAENALAEIGPKDGRLKNW